MAPSTVFHPGGLTRDDFTALDNLPNESALEINVTHKQLVDFKELGWETVALSPTRYAEGNIASGGGPLGKGYDINYVTAREIVFQHKAPKKTVIRGEDNQNKRLWLRYNIDSAQLLNLAVQYEPRQAYLALPLVPQERLLDKSLHMTMFIDVWTLYSRILEDGLMPDYLLIEYLPNWDPDERPEFDSEGKLSYDEYFKQDPVIKCKHKSRKWGMKFNERDPYIELSLGDTLFSHAVQWNPIKKTFKNSFVGLEIANNLRSDGGNRSPEDWPPVELSDEYSEGYQKHLERKYALSRLGREYEDPESEFIIQWILDDLDNRYSRATEMEDFGPLSPQVDEEMLSEDLDETSTRDILDNFVGKSNPETYRLRDTRRYVLQSGQYRDTGLQLM